MKYASLVVLSYKRPDMLHQSLVSLMNSTPKMNFELIVVDDGSRDANWPFLMQTARARDLSTLVLNAGENLGVGTGMNRGFGIARGEWVGKFDADLEYLPGWLDKGVALLENFPEVGVVGFFDYKHYSPSDPRFNKLSELNRAGETVGYVVDDFVGSAFLMRRADWLKYGVAGLRWEHKDSPPVVEGEIRFQGFEEGSAAFAEDVAWKTFMQRLGYKLAITATDTIRNFGFGLGNSTVVVPDSQGKPVVAKIGKMPVLFGRKSAS